MKGSIDTGINVNIWYNFFVHVYKVFLKNNNLAICNISSALIIKFNRYFNKYFETNLRNGVK